LSKARLTVSTGSWYVHKRHKTLVPIKTQEASCRRTSYVKNIWNLSKN